MIKESKHRRIPLEVQHFGLQGPGPDTPRPAMILSAQPIQGPDPVGARTLRRKPRVESNSAARAQVCAHPNGLMPLHQPLPENALPPGMTAPEFAAHKATRHLGGLTDATKTGAYLGWAGNQAGRLTGSLSGVAGLSEIGFPFAVGSMLCSLYDAYSTGTDARKAGDDYLFTIVTLEQQEGALAQAEVDPSADPTRLQMLRANVAALSSFAAGYEGAYYPSAQLPYLKAARAELKSMAKECVALSDAMTSIHNRIEALGIELESSSQTASDEGPVVLAMQSANLEERVELLQSAHGDMADQLASLQARMKSALSRKHLRALAETALKEAVQAHEAARQSNASPSDMEALEARVRALESDVETFKVSARRLLFHPFEGQGHAAIKAVRDVQIQVSKAPVDLSTAVLGLLTAVEVGNFFLQATGLGFVGGVLGLGMARLDRMDARRAQEKATVAKLVVVRQAAQAAQVYNALKERNDPQARRGQYLAWLRIRQLARLLRTMHRLTLQEKTRGGKAAAATLNTLSGFILAGVAIGLSNPLTAIPTAVLAAAIGGGFVASVGVRAYQRGAEKRKHKARLWAGQQAVRRLGVRGAMSIIDTPDAAALAQLRAPMQDLQHKLMNTHGEKAANWDLLDPLQLVENEGLGVAYLTQALHEHARDIGPDSPCWEAELLKSLGMDASKLDWLLSPQAIREHGTPARHKRALHLAVCEFYGVKPYAPDRLPLQDTRPEALLAMLSADTIGAWANGPVGSVLMTDDLLTSLAKDPQSLDRWMAAHSNEDRAALQLGLQQLREELAEQDIGPNELWAVQELLLEQENGAQPPLLLSGPLGDPTRAVNLLELLADPSWTEPKPALPPITVAVDQGPQTIERVLKAIKAVGRQMRDGKAAQTADTKPSADPHAVSRSSHSAKLRRRARSLGRAISQPLRSTQASFKELGVNPMASPQKALALLRGASGEAHLTLMKDILTELVKAAGGVQALESDPAILAALDDQARQAAGGMPFKVSQESKRRAHLITWLQQAAAAAAATAEAIENVHGGHKADSHSLARLRTQMQGMGDLCTYLCSALEADANQGERLLGIHLRSLT